MSSRSDKDLDRLLAGGARLSRPEREAILGDVLDRVGAAEPQRQQTGWFGIFAALAVAAALLLALGVSLRAGPGESERDDVFTARGVDAGPQLTLVCKRGEIFGPCSNRSELMLELASLGEWTHVGVFARGPDDTVIWYEPGPEGRTTPLPTKPEAHTVLLPRRVDLSENHPPGRYEVTAVLSRAPLSRADIKSFVVDGPKSGIRALSVTRMLEIR